MRLHRFFVGSDIALEHDFWLRDERILNQWNRVLRFRAGQEVVLFDGLKHDRLFLVTEISKDKAHLKRVTDYDRKIPKKEVYLLWALLKKDKNDWVLQKCTELGVSHFVPLVTDRTEKTGFDIERAKKITIEAAEQCGRSDIPIIRDPMSLSNAIDELEGKVELYICDQEGTDKKIISKNVGICVGPEGGWSDSEKRLLKSKSARHLNIHEFTLRAETACVAAVTMVR